MRISIAFFVIVLLSQLALGEIINVPEDFETIQLGINNAEDTDTVLVHPGVYEENLNVDRNIVLGSLTLTTGDPAYSDSTVIDGGGNGSVMTLNGEILVRGFTVQNGGGVPFGGGLFCSGGGIILEDLMIVGNGADSNGGGVFASNANVTLRRVDLIENNSRSHGGGFSIQNGSTLIEDCEFLRNESGDAGGIHGINSDVVMRHVLIAQNLANSSLGGAAEILGSTVSMERVTITGNQAVSYGAFTIQGEQLTITNSIIFGNFSPDRPLIRLTGDNQISFTDLAGGEDVIELGEDARLALDELIDEDPLFVNPDEGDYHLTEDSPCIDAGDPEGDPDPDGTRADMGAFYFHQQVDQNPHRFDVPDEFETIQAAINATEDGDTVLVHPGVYEENITIQGNKVLASLTLTTGDPAYSDSTVIDGGGDGTVLVVRNECLVIGLTIRNGRNGEGGGVVVLREATATLRHVKLIENEGIDHGGGIITQPLSTLIMEDCESLRNTAGEGSGIICYGNVTLNRVLISNNEDTEGGSVIFVGGAALINQVTVSDNQCRGPSAGLTFFHPAEGTAISNCIIYGNGGDGETQVHLSSRDNVEVSLSYCDIEGDVEAIDTDDNVQLNIDEIINEDPLFVNPDDGDYHLTEDSPCIDAGDPESDPDPDGTIADMGAFYFHQEPDQNPHRFDVPDEFETIQAAINATEDGDTVLVHPGEYLGNINFNGRNISVGSLFLLDGDEGHVGETIIDGNEQAIAVIIKDSEETALIGFTIRNGVGRGAGGGIYCNNSNPVIESCFITDNISALGGGIWSLRSDVTLRNCVFSGNVAASGGGLFFDTSTALVVNCDINNNVTEGRGGGVVSTLSDVVIDNCSISNNISADEGCGGIHAFAGSLLISCTSITDNIGANGGGIYVVRGTVGEIINCTICNNSTEGDVGGIYLQDETSMSVLNSIIFANEPNQIGLADDAEIQISWSDIEDGWEGEGNVVENPLFFNPDEGDYHLTEDSPCLDAGDPEYDPDPDGTRVDMGAFYLHQRDIDVFPDTLLFTDGEIGVTDSLRMSIGNVGLTTLHISGISLVEVESPFEINDYDEFDLGPDESLDVWIRYAPYEYARAGNHLLIESDDPDEGEILVRVFSSAVNSVESELESTLEFALSAAYPNPFNSTTTIEYALPFASDVTLNLYNLSGQRIETLAEGRLQAGVHRTMLDAGDMPSGLYFMKLEGAGLSLARKVMLIR